MLPDAKPQPNAQPKHGQRRWLYDAALALVLLLALYLRTTGLDWDSGQHLHPDERFLTMVGSAIQPVHSLSEYFDTARSSLNPANHGFGFYVYGDLPLFIVRYVAQALHKTDYGHIYLVGRVLSAFADLLIIFLLYLLGERLFNRRIALLAAAFSALAVLQIQYSHFFAVDNYASMFSLLALYIAVVIAQKPPERPLKDDWALYIAFGLAYGAGMASKISVAPAALLLPTAALIRLIRLPEHEQRRQTTPMFLLLGLGGLVSLLTFRVLQPYAFSGPGFISGLNPHWIDNLRQLRAQTSGKADFPPAMQWARRPIWFGWQNITFWGLGLPLALSAWAGFLWMAWRTVKRPERYLLLWGWTALFFTWESLQGNPTLRYFLPIYPLLALMAAWFWWEVWERWRGTLLRRWATIAGATAVALLTLGWAFAFVNIYHRPHTRVAATRWIFEHIPGAITLQGQNGDRPFHQLLPFPQGAKIEPNAPYTANFVPRANFSLSGIYFPHIKAASAITFSLQEQGEPSPFFSTSFSPPARQSPQTLDLKEHPIPLQAGKAYTLSISGANALLCGPIQLEIEPAKPEQPVISLPLSQPCIRVGAPVTIPFTTSNNAVIKSITLTLAQRLAPLSGVFTLKAAIISADGSQVIAKAHTVARWGENGEASAAISFTQPPALDSQRGYRLVLAADAPLSLEGARIANETSWDDGLPLRMDGYDPFGGIYSGLNFEMYWDDNEDKRQRFYNILDSADVIMITSSRQWASLSRLPERYPLVNAYYRHLMGCPAWMTVEHCYNIARVGTFHGDFGFRLTKVYESDPSLGPIRINDQPSEEAFTVYDHPKVFIFTRENYNPAAVRAALAPVDLEHVVHLPPGEMPPHPANLLLPPARWGLQQISGTFASLFPEGNPLNRWQWLGVLAWYLLIALLGWLALPLIRPFFRSFPDAGYPAGRLVGMMIFAYGAWLLGSWGVPVTRGLLVGVLAFFAAASGIAAWLQFPAIKDDLRRRKREIIWAEIFFLAFFLLDLYIRWNNPDLWHPWKGGEKPMDFSFLMATLKTATFPPYDPWFAQGYINYYYWGFVLVGMPVKLLGITPTVAYNLILPTLFGVTALVTFALVRGLYVALKREGRQARMVGLAGTIGLVLLGNLGTVKMIWQGFEKVAAAPNTLDTAGALKRTVLAIEGFFKVLGGARLPYSIGDWYWIPSRAIPAKGEVQPITEFPFFTFLYADLHAHLMALGITLLTLLWGVGLVLYASKHKPDWRWWAGSLAWGGFFIGALRATNTWDWPTYLFLGIVAVSFAAWEAQSKRRGFWSRATIAASAAAWLILASLLFFAPYTRWYAQGYTKVHIWHGTHTPLSAYFIHWGLFLYILISWLYWETRRWLAETPAVKGLIWWRRHGGWALASAAFTAVLTIGVALGFHAQIAWLVVPLLAWDGALLLRRGQPIPKRVVLTLFGFGLALTLMVEIIVLAGDIARMNTVFKFYFQVWTMFAVSAAVALGLLVKEACLHKPKVRNLWSAGLLLLVWGAALFPVIGGAAKMQDRMAEAAPHTLDGMAYMQYAHYYDQNTDMPLNEDYAAIRWMQEHVKGTPVIVEANTVEYRWGTRYTIYTGLPGVVGWNWHERQQRGVVVGSEWVTERVAEVGSFYRTDDLEAAKRFLAKYGVRYIVVGRLERAYYGQSGGLDKFPLENGKLWRAVFQDGETTIYEVMRQGAGK